VWAQTSGQTPIVFNRTIGGYSFDMELVTYFGERGLHVATTVDTKGADVTYAPARPVYNNTSIILNISPTNELTINTIQIRVGLNGEQEQWFGRTSTDGYPFSRGVVPTVNVVQHVRMDGTFAPFQYLGSVVQGQMEGLRGFQVETFVPWTSMGLDSAPDDLTDVLFIMPELNVALTYNAPRNGMLVPPGMVFDEPSSWAMFDGQGYLGGGTIEIDLDGDLSDWADRTAFEHGRGVHVRDVRANDNRGFSTWAFLGEAGLYIAVEAHHNRFETGHMGDQRYYHTHWYRNTNLELWVNTSRNPANNARIYTHRWVDSNNRSSPGLNTAWVTVDRYDNPDFPGWVQSNENPRFTSTIEIFIGRRALANIMRGVFLEGTVDEHVYIGFNFRTGSAGIGASAYEQINLISAGRQRNNMTQWGPFYGGFQDFQNQIPVFRDGIGGDRLGIDANNAYGITLDGDLSDWGSRAGISLGDLPTAGVTTNGVTFWAFLGNDGLYIAARALHAHHRSNSNIWHANTNLEFWINHRHQHFVTPYWSAPYVDAIMVTRPPGTGDGQSGVAGHYLTTWEVFVPMWALERAEGGVVNPGTADAHVRVGFAAGMGGGTNAMLQSALMGDTTQRTYGWWVTGRNPYVFNNQHFIYSDAMLTTARTTP